MGIISQDVGTDFSRNHLASISEVSRLSRVPFWVEVPYETYRDDLDPEIGVAISGDSP